MFGRIVSGQIILKIVLYCSSFCPSVFCLFVSSFLMSDISQVAFRGDSFKQIDPFHNTSEGSHFQLESISAYFAISCTYL